MAGRGSAPGERRGGRGKGTPNKVTAEIRSLAQPYGPAIVRRFAELAGLVRGVRPSENEATVVAAMKELLDRGYGKPRQAVDLDVAGELTVRGGIDVPPRVETWDEWHARWRADIEALEGPARPTSESDRRLLNP